MDPYTDQIGARLAEPEKWPDDVARVRHVCDHPYKGVGIDFGCSDGAVIRAVMDANPKATFCYAYDERDLTGTPGWSHPRIEFRWGVPWSYPPLVLGTRTSLRKLEWITVTEVLEHLPVLQVHRTLEYLVGALAHEGMLVVTVPNRGCHVSERERWTWPTHRSFWAISQLDGLLRTYCREVYTSLIVDGIWIEAVCFK